MGLLKAFLMQPKKYLTCMIVGTPTINGNIITDISSSNYVRYATADILSGHSWEICLKIYWNGSTNNCIYLRVADNASYLRVGTNGSFTFNGYDTTNANWWVHGTGSFPKNIAGWYYIKLKYEIDTGTIRTYWGTNSAEMTLARSVAKGAGVELRYLTASRYIYSNANAGNGQIDIGGSYIKVENTKYNLKLPQ